MIIERLSITSSLSHARRDLLGHALSGAMNLLQSCFLQFQPKMQTKFVNVFPDSESFLLQRNNRPRLFLGLTKCVKSSTKIWCNVSQLPESEILDDSFYMRRCVDLARRAVGCTSPNPMVGCVIVKGGAIIGEGFHPKAGYSHAEVFALRDAGEQAENSTAYVSLEPCNHYGRTPPCTEALIKARVKRVVVGMVDPNPIVASKGVERLRSSGIDVTVGIEEDMCKRLNEAYIHRMLSGRPFVTARYSLAINGGGIIEHATPQAKELEGYYSQLLQECDGVIVSSSSFDQKSTLPTSAEQGANQPIVIVLVPKDAPPLSFPASVDLRRRIVIFLEDGATIDPETNLKLNQIAIEQVFLRKLVLSPILEYCLSQGMCSVLLDLAGELSWSREILHNSLEEGLVQKVVVELCSSRLGQQNVVELLAPFQLRHLRSWVSKGSVVVEGYIA